MLKINWSKILDWSIEAVHLPRPHWGKFDPKGDTEEQILFYSVQVDYKYHGSRLQIFNETNQFSPLDYNKAMNFYNKVRSKIAGAKIH